MPYLLLLGAIAFEVSATSLLRTTEGFTRVWPTVACLGGYALAFAALAFVVRYVQVGIAYAIWSGLGTVAIMALDVAFRNESLTGAKVAGVLLVIGGVVLLNLQLDQ